MAVVPGSVELNWAGSTGSIDRDGPVEYTALWNIETDDPLDQVQTILIWWQLNMFGLGFPYAYANDLFGSLATSQNISANRKKATNTSWIVVVKYSRESDDSKQTTDDPSEHTSDPLTYRPEVHCSSNSFTESADKLIYISGQPGPAAGLGYAPGVEDTFPGFIGGGISDSDPMVPVASNKFPFDPLPEVDTAHWYVSVKENKLNFDGADARVTFLNSATFSIDYNGFTYGPIAPRQAKIRDCEVAFERTNSIDHWAIRYYFEILPAGETFELEIPDIGMDAIGCDGAPDAEGGHYSSLESVLPGRSESTSLKDRKGDPIRSPVNLDGAGTPANICRIPFRPVAALWWEGKEVDFNFIPVLNSILAPLLP